jgi:hypothetical protein
MDGIAGGAALDSRRIAPRESIRVAARPSIVARMARMFARQRSRRWRNRCWLQSGLGAGRARSFLVKAALRAADRVSGLLSGAGLRLGSTLI